MNDYNMIPNMNSDLCRELHNKDVEWLRSELDKTSTGLKSVGLRLCSPGTPGGVLGEMEFDHTVVITHHMPSYKLVGNKYSGNPMNSFYASNLDELVKKADIWCCGHSHCARQIIIGFRPDTSVRCYGKMSMLFESCGVFYGVNWIRSKY